MKEYNENEVVSMSGYLFERPQIEVANKGSTKRFLSGVPYRAFADETGVIVTLITNIQRELYGATENVEKCVRYLDEKEQIGHLRSYATTFSEVYAAPGHDVALGEVHYKGSVPLSVVLGALYSRGASVPAVKIREEFMEALEGGVFTSGSREL
jgi:hypothetical protein